MTLWQAFKHAVLCVVLGLLFIGLTELVGPTFVWINSTFSYGFRWVLYPVLAVLVMTLITYGGTWSTLRWINRNSTRVNKT